MATKIQIRRDTAANWTTNDPVLSVGEQGFEIDTNKMKIGDGTTAFSALAYVAGGATGLELSRPADSNEYWIYVGNPTNKLALIQDSRGNISNATYDQEFATLQEAFNFVQNNTLVDTGYSSNIAGGEDLPAAWVIACEDGVTHAAPAASTYFVLRHVNQQVLLLNQESLNPAAGIPAGATIGDSVQGDWWTMYNVDQIQIGGDLIMATFLQAGMSNIKWFYNTYTNDVVWNGGMKIYDQSIFYTDGAVNVATARSVSVENGSHAQMANITVSGGGSVRSRDGSYLSCGDISCTNGDVEVSGTVFAGNITIDGANKSLRLNANGVLHCGTITFNGTATVQFFSYGQKVVHGGILGNSTNTTFKVYQADISQDLATFTTAVSFSNVFAPKGTSWHNSAATAGTTSFPDLPTVDPVDGGKSFYLNAGVMTLSS